MDLDARPWADMDGPSLAGCAAALQLLPENIPCLLRAQRLAAIGAALPARPDASPLSPSRLRAVLKHPLIAGEAVLTQEDPYDDVYVEEVAFHGGSRLVLQGLTNHSAHTARVLLNAIFGSAGDGLPSEYARQARLLTDTVLSLSHAACSAAGLRRGVTTTEVRRRELFVPGHARLGELCAAVTFTAAARGSRKRPPAARPSRRRAGGARLPASRLVRRPLLGRSHLHRPAQGQLPLHSRAFPRPVSAGEVWAGASRRRSSG